MCSLRMEQQVNFGFFFLCLFFLFCFLYCLTPTSSPDASLPVVGSHLDGLAENGKTSKFRAGCMG